jgi:hypothetical protein
MSTILGQDDVPRYDIQEKPRANYAAEENGDLEQLSIASSAS